jgi:hypothetical protein
MRKLAAVAGIAAAVFAVGVVPASGVLIKTNWVEKTRASWGGTYTIYVRELEITKTTWRARVGIVNRTRAAMHIEYGLERQGARTVFVHGPGIWFQGPATPGSKLSVPRHADATSVRPPLPHILRVGQSWFATIRGPSAKLPKDRLLRIGFGFLYREGQQYSTEISTTHQFKLPRRLR